MSMIFYSPDCPTSSDVAQHAADLHPFGVRIRREDDEAPTFKFVDDGGRRVLLKHIGDLTVWPADGLIYAWPMRGLSDTERHVLLGSAARAFHEPPTEADGWDRRDNGWDDDSVGLTYWQTQVYAVLDQGGSEALQIARMDRAIDELRTLASRREAVTR